MSYRWRTLSLFGYCRRSSLLPSPLTLARAGFRMRVLACTHDHDAIRAGGGRVFPLPAAAQIQKGTPVCMARAHCSALLRLFGLGKSRVRAVFQPPFSRYFLPSLLVLPRNLLAGAAMHPIPLCNPPPRRYSFHISIPVHQMFRAGNLPATLFLNMVVFRKK